MFKLVEMLENAKAIERGDLKFDKESNLIALRAEDRCYFRLYPKVRKSNFYKIIK